MILLGLTILLSVDDSIRSTKTEPSFRVCSLTESALPDPKYLPHRLLPSELQSKALVARLTSIDGKVRLRVSNSSSKLSWLVTENNALAGTLQVFDGTKWRLIESNYTSWGGCIPNDKSQETYVALPTGYGWTFDREIPYGTYRTEVRWVGKSDQAWITSNTVEAYISEELVQEPGTIDISISKKRG